MSDNQNNPKPETIDLTKIANIDAVRKVDATFESKVVDQAKRGKAKKFAFAEPELVPLPSKGRLYTKVTGDEDVLRGYIKMFPMTMKEEEVLSTSRFIKSGSATRMILDRTIASKIEAKDILIFDSNFLMFHLRRLSYGDDYNFTITCNNASCEKKFEHKVQISKLIFEELSDEVVEPIVVKLPYSKYTVKTMMPRLYHSEELAARSSNRVRKADEEDKRLIENLLVTTLEVLDEVGNPIDRRDWEEFFEAIPGIDAAELRQKTTFSTGVDTLKGVTCPYCESDYSGTIPIGTEFFRF